MKPSLDLLEKLAEEAAASSTREVQDYLDFASTLWKRKCNLLIKIQKYEKVQDTSPSANVPLGSSNTTKNLTNRVISTTAANFSIYASTWDLSTFDLDAHQCNSFSHPLATSKAGNQANNSVTAYNFCRSLTQMPLLLRTTSKHTKPGWQ